MPGAENKLRWLCPACLLLPGCMLVFPVPATGAGCRGESASFYPASDVVRLRAASDLACARDQILLEARSDSSFRATGCGSTREYECEDDAVSGCSLEDAAERESCRVVP